MLICIPCVQFRGGSLVEANFFRQSTCINSIQKSQRSNRIYLCSIFGQVKRNLLIKKIQFPSGYKIKFRKFLGHKFYEFIKSNQRDPYSIYIQRKNKSRLPYQTFFLSINEQRKKRYFIHAFVVAIYYLMLLNIV